MAEKTHWIFGRFDEDGEAEEVKTLLTYTYREALEWVNRNNKLRRYWWIIRPVKD